jgi:inorganic pyrophosphatase
MNAKNRILPTLVLPMLLSLGAAPLATAQDHAATPVQLPAKDIDKSFLTSVLPMNADGTVSVVVDPASKAKKGALILTTGRIPRTILAKEKGGNGEMVAAFVLGATAAPGAIVRGRDIATICRTAAGKDDCRAVVVPRDGAFGPYTTVEMIEAKAPGTLAGLKERIGPAKDATFSVKGRKETIAFVGDAIADFENSLIKDADKRPLDRDGNPMLYKWAGSRNIGE